MEEWYDMRLVGQCWKRAIDGCPKLWRRVDLLSGWNFVEKQVERAKGVPLWVQTDLEKYEALGLAWVVAYADQIERLTLFVAPDEKHGGVGIVNHIFNITQFPCLRGIHILREGPVREGEASEGETVSLALFPAQFVDPSALAHIEFTGVSYPISALAANISLRVLRLDIANSNSRIALADLQKTLPALPMLDCLTLGGSLDIDNDDLKRPPSIVPSLTEFVFIGSVACLDHFLAIFLLPGISSWNVRLRAGRMGVPTESRLRGIIKAYAASPTKVILRLVSSTESQV